MATFPLYGTGGLAQTRAGRRVKKRGNKTTSFFMNFILSDNWVGVSRVGGYAGMRFGYWLTVDRHGLHPRDDRRGVFIMKEMK